MYGHCAYSQQLIPAAGCVHANVHLRKVHAKAILLLTDQDIATLHVAATRPLKEQYSLDWHGMDDG